MANRKVLDLRGPNARALVELIENHPSGMHDYGIPAQAWRRAASLMDRLGADRALEIIDARADQAVSRGNLDAARRWRDLIVAIHAIQEDERLLGESSH